MVYHNELDFEKDFIELLTENGWEKEILKYKTEEDLIQNWANILFENNRSIDRLNDCPLTQGEMSQILEEINNLKTPLKLNSFINGGSVTIKRDNENDELHFGKEVSLKIYDRAEIIGGQSRYQIAEQPIFKAKKDTFPDRRGDFLLLINGMPLFHVELKKSGIPVSQACNQIKKYAHEGIFSGLFSLIQIFVAMTPEETKYFANPGPDGVFNEKYYFHWADFNNKQIKDYKQIASTLLHIPTAHQLIGFYTVADNNDGILKVMRSYQYYAANGIADKVAKSHWETSDSRGGYIWHTTGSGKTMTSFKTACLIANSKDADKVVFLMDRIELGTQSLNEYRGFADVLTEVQETEDTYVLIDKLKSNKANDTLIVTSIQKMSNIKSEIDKSKVDVECINKKRLVFIVDECHRSTFGTMLSDIKIAFPKAMFFGFTGTPIQDKNKKNDTTTADIFGNEIHRYCITDGISDHNVLGFDPVKVCTFIEDELRIQVGLRESHSKTIEEVLADPARKKIFEKYTDHSYPMVSYIDDKGNKHKGIESFIPDSQYNKSKHRETVLKDIIDNWLLFSRNNKFHAILATNSINEAIEYYRLLKKKNKLRPLNFNFTAMFDQSIDNNEGSGWKEDALVEILEDYNANYKQTFTLSTFKKFQKDVANRLAHKKPYLYIQNEPSQQLHLLIVVDQMLTGYDSKWINCIYLDKFLKNEHIIQAFSRTNRLCDDDKPYGMIRYYRYPNTMQKLIEEAFKLYSGNEMYGVFVDKLEKNIKEINACLKKIVEIFKTAKIENFEKLPETIEEVKMFAVHFQKMGRAIIAAKLQGFELKKQLYKYKNDKDEEIEIRSLLDTATYNILLQRYLDIQKGSGSRNKSLPFELDNYLIGTSTGIIDAEWMNERFQKYLKALQTGEDVEKAKTEIAKAFANLSQEQQKYANIFLHDIESGDIIVDNNKTLIDYIIEYQEKAKNDEIHKFSQKIGVDEEKLREIMKFNINEKNINERGRFDALIETVNIQIAKEYFEALEEKSIPEFRVKQKVDKILRDFILKSGK